MKKKILSMCLVVALLAIAIVGGTLAYFTDTDKDVNVMTTGNVQIKQNETDRNGNAYVDNQKLIPAVYGPNGLVDPTNGEYHQDDTVKNVLDKFVTVTNTGSESCYARTIVLIEDDADLSVLYGGTDKGVKRSFEGASYFTIDGVTQYYNMYIFTYTDVIEPNATSPASLRQVWLKPTAENGWLTSADGDLDIIVFSQAVQSQGFTSAEEALTAAYGANPPAETQVAAWVEAANVDTTGDANTIS